MAKGQHPPARTVGYKKQCTEESKIHHLIAKQILVILSNGKFGQSFKKSLRKFLLTWIGASLQQSLCNYRFARVRQACPLPTMRSAFCIAVAAAAVVVSVVAAGSISNYNMKGVDIVKTTLSDGATESGAGTEPGPTGAATMSNLSPQLIFGEPVVSGVMKQSQKQRINERLEQSKCAQHENDGRRRGSRRGLVYRGPDHTAAAGAPDDAASCTSRRGISHSSSDPPSSSGNSRLRKSLHFECYRY